MSTIFDYLRGEQHCIRADIPESADFDTETETSFWASEQVQSYHRLHSGLAVPKHLVESNNRFYRSKLDSDI